MRRRRRARRDDWNWAPVPSPSQKGIRSTYPARKRPLIRERVEVGQELASARKRLRGNLENPNYRAGWEEARTWLEGDPKTAAISSRMYQHDEKIRGYWHKIHEIENDWRNRDDGRAQAKLRKLRNDIQFSYGYRLALSNESNRRYRWRRS